MRSLAFSPDGRYLAASADPGPVCLYELNGWREQRRLVGHAFGAQCVAFHPRLPRLASGSDDCSIFVWDAEKASPVRQLAGLQNLGHGASVQPRRLAAGKRVRKFERVCLCE